MPLVRFVTNKTVAGFLILMGLAEIVLGFNLWQQRQDSEAFTHCTAAWQANFVRAYEARAAAAGAVSDAMDDVVNAVDAQDPVAFKKAVHHYLQVREEQNQQRTQHPLPPLPTVACGQ